MVPANATSSVSTRMKRVVLPSIFKVPMFKSRNFDRPENPLIKIRGLEDYLVPSPKSEFHLVSFDLGHLRKKVNERKLRLKEELYLHVLGKFDSIKISEEIGNLHLLGLCDVKRICVKRNNT